MPSSTSSSEFRRVWTAALALFLALFAASELAWRARGFVCSVTDTRDAWCLQRQRVGRAQRPTIAVVGASRMQLGIVPEVLEQALPGHQVVMLAIDGHEPRAVLRDLAEDPDFGGIILAGSSAGMFRPSEAQRPWVEHYRRKWDGPQGFDEALNTRIALALQERLVVLNQELGLKRQVHNFWQLRPSYIRMDAARYRPAAYFQGLTPEELERHRANRAAKARAEALLPAGVFEDDVLGELRRLAGLQRRKGGLLLLVHMPLTGESREVEESRYPRTTHWDRLVRETGCPGVHFQDHPELAGFDCPDTSHLDHADAVAFTRALGRILAPLLADRATDP